MNTQRLDLILELGSHKPIDVWEIMYSKISQTDWNVSKVKFYSRDPHIEEVSDLIIDENLEHFYVELNEAAFGFGPVTNYKHILVQIKEKINHQIPWINWINEFLDLKGFVQAWVTDVEYDFWQNAADPLEYTTNARSFENLPMKSNGLPYPVHQMIIDTSKNPGLREIRKGYVTGVGSPMWLGNLFWQYSANSKETVINELKEKVTIINNSICIKMTEEPFVDEETAEKQFRLRNLLYKNQ